MVENQLRPNNIKEKNILKLFNEIAKEKFIPDEFISQCYSDMNLDITASRGYLKNLHLAQIITKSKIIHNDKVLHVGGLTGYLSIMISKLCDKLYVIEKDNSNYVKLIDNIKNYNLNNVFVINLDFINGYNQKSPYDLIIIDCPIYRLNNIFINQLNNNGGRLIYIQKINNELSKAYKIIKNDENLSKEYLFDVFTYYSLDEKSNEFKF